MKLEEIKEAVDAGKKVHWKYNNYRVIKGKYEYGIQCVSNKYWIGLTHADNVTMNGDEGDFYIDEQPEEISNVFDAWEYPQKCERCGLQDNYDEKYPTTILDTNTKLCEFCFGQEK